MEELGGNVLLDLRGYGGGRRRGVRKRGGGKTRRMRQHQTREESVGRIDRSQIGQLVQLRSPGGGVIRAVIGDGDVGDIAVLCFFHNVFLFVETLVR